MRHRLVDGAYCALPVGCLPGFGAYGTAMAGIAAGTACCMPRLADAAAFLVGGGIGCRCTVHAVMAARQYFGGEAIPRNGQLGAAGCVCL